MEKFRKIEYLLACCQRGWPILPLHWIEEGRCSCGKTGCRSPGKHPLVEGGFKAASADSRQVKIWHTSWPQANWGLRTGSLESGGSGLVVVDIDPKNHGFESWEKLSADQPDQENTVTVRSGGGGRHLWYRCPSGVKLRSSAGRLAPGVDVRADGGYILIPPSRTVASYSYELNPAETPILELPGWLHAALEKPSRSSKKVGLPKSDAPIPQGQRHQVLLSTALRYRRAGIPETEIFSALVTMRDTRLSPGDHPVSDDELASIAAWASSLNESYDDTDASNGGRFVDQHGDQVRYCFGRKSWLEWNGKVWKLDSDANVRLRAELTARRILIEADNEPDEKISQMLYRHARRSKSASRMRSMLECAQPHLQVDTSELDCYPNLLNLRNGILDLRTGELSPHDSNLMMTHLVDVDYLPGATCPAWLEFLEIVTGGDFDLIDFLQRCTGYCLTGRVDEHVLFMLIGPGGTGKTTFMETLKMILGTYAVKVPIESLLDHARGSANVANPYIARLAGARLAQSSETPEDCKLHESQLKELTGGDKITGRHLFKEPIDFKPSHKLWLVGNYAPRLIGATHTNRAIWRRVRLIPFDHPIPAQKHRRQSAVMQSFSAEKEGILAWMVAGAMRWYIEGLGSAPQVSAATSDYRSDQDVVGQFLQDCCLFEEKHKTLKKQIYRAWQTWCQENGEREHQHKSNIWLTRKLVELGYRTGGAGNMFYLGLILAPNRETLSK